MAYDVAEASDAPRREQAAAPSPRCFTRLLDRFYGPVYDYLCWLTRDGRLAEDLAQETFLQIWRSPPDWTRRRALRAWVFKVALNAYRQRARRRAPGSLPLEEVEDSLPDLTALPPLLLEREELARAVRQAVAELPEPFRQVIVLHRFEGLKLREVAVALEIPLGTVKSRLATAFSLLRKSLREWEGYYA